MAIQEREEMAMDPAKKAQIEAQSGAQIEDTAQVGVLLFDEDPTEVPTEYFDYSNVFSAGNVVEHQENTRINEYAIKLEKGKQPLFKLIYSLGPIGFETKKIYIEINLINGFIWPSKPPIQALILFNWKPDRSFYLCVDYWSLNHITIKNRYPLPLIGESFDWLGQTRRFTQLYLTNAYHQMRIHKGDELKTNFRT